MANDRWEFWIDRGGTFTDCIGLDPVRGELHIVKVLSSDDAPLQGIRRILGLGDDAALPPCDVRMGTTVATNALLERRGVPCALVTTAGLGDLLEIGTQTRPDLFALNIEKPTLLHRRVIETAGRVSSDGEVLSPPDDEALRAALEGARRDGIESVAVVLVHSYAYPGLEQQAARVAREVGFEHVSESHAIAGELGMLARGDTAVLDAYLTPLLTRYLERLGRELPDSTLRLMQSSGGLTDAKSFRGPAAILSGPAGGVVACAHVARVVGLGEAIGFDMGGTSTDVSRVGREPARIYETETAGVRIRAPMMDVHTVAAGGGSLCRFDGYTLTVGPESAGATPGPLCYGHPSATEPTITDVNLVLGRLQADRFPFPLDVARARAGLEAVRASLPAADRPSSVEALAQGFLDIANTKMAEAIRRVTVARGYDLRDHGLVVFGGAGGQHACALAGLLEVDTIVVPPLAGVLSAYGMGLAADTWHGESDAGRVSLTPETIAALEPKLVALEEEGRRALSRLGRPSDVVIDRRLDVRYQGTESALTITCGNAAEVLAEFERVHDQRFGYARPGHALEITVARVEARSTRLAPQWSVAARAGTAAAQRATRVWTRGVEQEGVPVYRGEHLPSGTRLAGPVLVLDATGSLVVDPTFTLEVRADRVFVIRRDPVAARAPSPSRRRSREHDRPDPITLEIMGNLYMSIAEQMGHVLRRTALSTNIRRRLDYSCAVFDGAGGLVANAPHIPVHLGAMSESVRAVLAAHPDLQPGDVFATNDPAGGGSHLPDVTVVTPVFTGADRPTFYVASRGHHADIGGITPGSMPPGSTELAQEGVVLRAMRIVHGGTLDRRRILDALTAGPYPARRPDENLADLEAQIAANRAGSKLLAALSEKEGQDRVVTYMAHVQAAAASKVADAIAALQDGEHRFEDALDDGTPVCVTLRVTGRHLTVDFTGTGGEHPGNLNAPRAVTTAAVLYFLRTLVSSSIPLNGGCLEPVEVIVPPASLLDPGPGRAVAGGNVETSQRLVDVLLGAAGVAAASQGTMNNLSFGTSRFGYYETIAGGAGAGPSFDGASAVHTHMTNTRITDPEVIEAQFPVRLLRFQVRRGSGGRGAHHGGDGVIRELEILAPMHLSILSERRERAPFGLAGGEPGARGDNQLNGVSLGGRVTLDVTTGDRILIATPGGGGYGAPAGSDSAATS